MPDTLLGGGAGEYQKLPEHHGGVAVAEALKAGGVERLFFLPGGHLAPVVNGCNRVGIDVISTRHESAAVFVAEALARTTGETGVAAVTAGPGFTSCVTGLANAQATGIPVAVLGGRTPLALRGRGAVQDADQSSVARAVATWTREVTRAEYLGISVREALAQACGGRPGSAYLDLPTDVLTAEVPAYEGGAVPRGPRRRRCVLSRHRRRAPGLRRGDGHPGDDHEPRPRPAARLAPERPRVAAPRWRRRRLRRRRADRGQQVQRQPALRRLPTVAAAPEDRDDRLRPGRPRPQPHADVALLGDAAVVLGQLAEAWTGEPKKAWCDGARSYAEGSMTHWASETEGDATGVHPGLLAREVCEWAAGQGPGSTIVLDGGDILGWGLAFARAEQPGSILFTSDALGTLGVGLPYAVAAPLARRDGPTVALIGDGAFGLSAMEIETAARHGLAPVIVVSNGERVERAEDLRPALDRALAAGVVAVVGVVTDPDRPNEVLRNMGTLNLQ